MRRFLIAALICLPLTASAQTKADIRVLGEYRDWTTMGGINNEGVRTCITGTVNQQGQTLNLLYWHGTGNLALLIEDKRWKFVPGDTETLTLHFDDDEYWRTQFATSMENGAQVIINVRRDAESVRALFDYVDRKRTLAIEFNNHDNVPDMVMPMNGSAAALRKFVECISGKRR